MGGAVTCCTYLVPIFIEFADQFDGDTLVEAQLIVILPIVVEQCLWNHTCAHAYTRTSTTHTFALGPLFIGFFGGIGLVDGVIFGGTGLGGAEVFLSVGRCGGLFGLKIYIVTFSLNHTCTLTAQVVS